MDSLKTFGWKPIIGASDKAKPDVRTVALGDGYEQRAPKGLNHNLRTFNVTFRSGLDEILDIDAFLQEHGGVTAFIYRPANRPVPKRVVCDSWSYARSTKTKKYELQATFREVVA